MKRKLFIFVAMALLFMLQGCTMEFKPLPFGAVVETQAVRPVASAEEMALVEPAIGGTEDIVNVPEVAYNEPQYYTPPVAVAYQYDYFMYVPNGVNVDIVFVDRYGHRHVEYWRGTDGRRMSMAHMHGWHRNYYRSHRAEMARHERVRAERRGDGSARHDQSKAGGMRQDARSPGIKQDPDKPVQHQLQQQQTRQQQLHQQQQRQQPKQQQPKQEKKKKKDKKENEN